MTAIPLPIERYFLKRYRPGPITNIVVSWATGVQEDVEIQMDNPTMKGFGFRVALMRDLVSNRRKNDSDRGIFD